MAGLAVACRSKFSVSSVCGSRRSQRWCGKSWANPASVAEKQDLNILMDLLDPFCLWTSGGKNWYSSTHFSFMVALYSLMHSLSSICKSTSNVLSFSSCIMMLYTACQCLYYHDDNVSTKITFEEWYTTMMYWLPLLPLVGNWPVSSVQILL